MTFRRVFLALSLLVSPVAATRAQTPIGPPQVDLATTEASALLESIAVDGQGNVTLLWQEERGRRSFVRRFSGTDDPLEAFQLTRFFTLPKAAANERGDTVVIWDQDTPASADEVRVRRLNPDLPPLTVRADSGRLGPFRSANDVGVDRQGRFVAVWTEIPAGSTSIHAQRFNADGTRKGRELILPGGNDTRVAMNQATGDFLIVWTDPYRGILGQRFSFSSGFLGKTFQIATPPLAVFSYPDAGCAEDGSCVVVWRQFRRRNRPGDVRVQRFGPDGKRTGGEIVIAETAYNDSPVSLAVAPEGHFVVGWTEEGGNSPVRVRLFRRDGTPAGPEIEIGTEGFAAFPKLAFAWDGTFVVGWTDLIGHLNDLILEVDYQRFAVPSGL